MQARPHRGVLIGTSGLHFYVISADKSRIGDPGSMQLLNIQAHPNQEDTRHGESAGPHISPMIFRAIHSGASHYRNP